MDYRKKISLLFEEPFDRKEIYSLLARPKEEKMGDFALPCFTLAKKAGENPVALAKKFSETLERPSFISSIEPAGGFLNFKIKDEELATSVIGEIFEKGENYGSSDEGKGRVICIDYSSINIAKPFHIGHLLTTVIGAALYRIYRFLGYKPYGINHLGDYGTQFGKMISAYKRWGNKDDIEKRGVTALNELYVRFHSEAEKDESLNDEGRHYFKLIEQGDSECVKIFEWFKKITLEEVNKVYERLGVKFDSYNGESFYNDKMEPVLEELSRKGLLKESDGAQVVELDGMPPCLLKKADGATLYATRDIAAAFYRKKTYDFYKCLYVVAYQQNLHFKQFFKVIELMGYDWAKDLQHIAFGMVSLEDGTLSTRKGKVVLLDEVLNKAVEKSLKIITEKNPDLKDREKIAEMIGVGAVIFFALFNGRIKDIVFSYDKVLTFDGETGPYVQYTCARCSSILEKGGKYDFKKFNPSAILNQEGRSIYSALALFPEKVKEAAEKNEPCVITRYITDIAQRFNKFYIEHKIIEGSKEEINAKLCLTYAVKRVITNGFNLLGIKAPDRM